ncbi:MAG: hypothetical protein IPO81_26440 [Kouleothrix sp.]|nr:hypothetical protein [Kouleothrix sp.]
MSGFSILLRQAADDVADIRGWMTLPYMARAYGVPEDALFDALAIPRAGNERLSVKQLVAKYGRDPQATRHAAPADRAAGAAGRDASAGRRAMRRPVRHPC